MTTDLFLKWLKHFQSFAKSSIDDKVILIVDGHASHKGIENLKYAKQNGIIIICLPPHCTHRMQPLDVSFFAPLKTYFNQETSKWLKQHPGRVVPQFQIAGLFKEAYGKAATVHNGCNGFKSTGIWPLNPKIFPDYMYEPAETTNIPLEDNSNLQYHQQTAPSPVPLAGPSTQQLDDSILLPLRNDLQASETTQTQHQQQIFRALTSDKNDTAQTTDSTEQVDNSTANTGQDLILPAPNQDRPSAGNKERPSSYTLAVPIENISSAPKGRYISGQGKRKPMRRQSSLILTSTLNMNAIKSKNEPKAPPEKRRRNVTKKLFEV